jgi:hypothetical protein
MSRIRTTRLLARDLDIEVRWSAFDGRWIASADSTSGPTLGLGWTSHEALTAALEPFAGVTDLFGIGTDEDGNSR